MIRLDATLGLVAIVGAIALIVVTLVWLSWKRETTRASNFGLSSGGVNKRSVKL